MAMNPFDEGPSGGMPAAVVSKVNGPAIGLLVTGILNVLASHLQRHQRLRGVDAADRRSSSRTRDSTRCSATWKRRDWIPRNS